MTRQESAAETLRELEARAMEQEAQHRFDSVDRRTVRFEVDGVRADVLGPPRLALLVVAAYPKWMEHNAFFGHANPGHRFNVEAHLAYVVEYEGVPLSLRGRKQALEVIETRALPRGVEAPARVVAPDMTEDEIDALFADVAARSRPAVRS